MNIEEIRLKIRSFIEENFYVDLSKDQVKDDTSLVDSGVVDSTGVLELVGFVEEEYKIQVDDSELVPDNFGSINNLANFIIKKLN